MSLARLAVRTPVSLCNLASGWLALASQVRKVMVEDPRETRVMINMFARSDDDHLKVVDACIDKLIASAEAEV